MACVAPKSRPLEPEGESNWAAPLGRAEQKESGASEELSVNGRPRHRAGDAGKQNEIERPREIKARDRETREAPPRGDNHDKEKMPGNDNKERIITAIITPILDGVAARPQRARKTSADGRGIR